MKKKLLNKIWGIGILLLFLGASVIPSVSANNENINSIQINKQANLPIGLQNSYNADIHNNKDLYFYSNPYKEKPSTEISEEVTILEDGTINLAIIIDVSSISLVDLYKESFGISPYTTNIDMEVPINTTRIIERELNGEITEKEVFEPVREKFYKGISEEQKYLFGFHVTEFISSRIKSEKSDELSISVEANAIPYITDTIRDDSRMVFTMSSAPTDIVNEFLYFQMGISYTMLDSMPTANTYEKSWNLEIILPKDGEFERIDDSNIKYEFDGGAYLQSKISQKSSNKLYISQKWKITDKHLSRESIDIDNLFEIKYSLSSLSTFDYEDFNYIFENGRGGWYDYGPWTGSWDFDFSITIKGVKCSFHFTIYLGLEGRVFVDPGDLKMVAYATITAGVNASVTIEGELEHTFSLTDFLGKYKGRGFDWDGTLPIRLLPHVEPTLEVEVKVGGKITVWVNPEVKFDVHAGVDVGYDWFWCIPYPTITPIFGYTKGGSFEIGYDLTGYAKIRPSIGIAFSVIVFELVGPRVTPELYLDAILNYNINDGYYWHAELGFALKVGLQITRRYHWDYPTPLVNIQLKEWDSKDDPDAGNPMDVYPPITKHHLRPWENMYPGWRTNFWFAVKDDGAAASGINETYYNIPITHGYDNWQLFDFDVMPIPSNHPVYTIYYYSTDVEGNEETTQSETFYPDLDPPTSDLTVENSPRDDMVEIYAEQTPITIDAQDDKTGTQIYYATWTEAGGWSNVISGNKNESVTHHFKLEDKGKCFINWFSMDSVGNRETQHSTVFYVTTPAVTLESVKMCEYIGGPHVTEFDYGQECFCEITLNNAVEGDTVTWMWKLNDQIRYVDTTYVSSSTCRNSWTPDLSGDWTVDIYYNSVFKGSSPAFNVIDGPEASLEDTFMCEYVGGPPVTEFDYNQECYSYCEFENIKSGDEVKWKWIWGQDGQAKHTSWETITDTSIWSSWTPVYSGDWYVDIYYKDVYVGSGPTFIVKDQEFPKGIITDFTVYPNPVEYNGDFTASVTGKNIGEVSGFFKIGLETVTHGFTMSEPEELYPGDTMEFNATFEGITQSTPCNATLWWLSEYDRGWDERDQILHDEEQIFIEVASQDTIGEINFTGSTFYSGPFPNRDRGRKVASVSVKNIGIHMGDIHIKLYEYPDSPDENLIFSKDWHMDPGVENECNVWIDISDGPEEGDWPVGIKVWGETESEPTWEIENKTHQWNLQIIEILEPQITTLDAINIKETNMVLKANLDDDGGEECLCGFWYGTNYPIDESNSQNVTCDQAISTGQTCSRYITDLTPGVLYYVKSWASNFEGFVTSENTLSFNTISSETVLPTVIINATTDKNETNATLNGFLFDDGGEPSTCGFWYGTTYPLTNATSEKVICDGKYVTGRSFSKTIGINPGETYYICSWAQNSKGLFVSNTTSYDNEFGDFSYTFDNSNINLGEGIIYTHSIEFPYSIWMCNSSISVNDSVENFLNQGEIMNNLDCIFHEEANLDDWTSWEKWRYEEGFLNSLTNIDFDTEYYFYINNSDLPVTIGFEFDNYTANFYDITFPSSIWAFNSSIKQDDTCENFCQQGGIWDDIDCILHIDTQYQWTKGGSHNTLTNLEYREHYRFRMLNKSEVSFVYDVCNYDDFDIDNSQPNKPSISGPISGTAGVEYDYTFVTIDPDGHDVSFYVEWGDGTPTDWTDYVASGTEITLSYTWSEKGTYKIRAKAKDILGAESSWAELTVTMPKDKVNLHTYPQTPKKTYKTLTSQQLIQR